MSKTKRIVSFILSMVMILSSVNVMTVYADDLDGNTSTGTGSGSGGSATIKGYVQALKHPRLSRGHIYSCYIIIYNYSVRYDRQHKTDRKIMLPYLMSEQ